MNGYHWIGLFLGALGSFELLVGLGIASSGAWEGSWIGNVWVGIFFLISCAGLFAYGYSKESDEEKGVEETKLLLERLREKEEDNTRVY